MARFGYRYDGFSRTVGRVFGMGPNGSWLEVEGGRLRVRMGWSFSLDAPLDAIAAGHRVDGEPFWRRITVGVHGWRRRWRVNAATGPIVRLRFREPQRARTMGIPVRVETLEVNPADPDAFLAAIGHAG